MWSFLKGINYSSELVYNILDFVKLKNQCNLRYRIAASYIKPIDSVLDVCAGTGRLAKFLPKGCKYFCIEKSPQFQAGLTKKKIRYYDINLHDGIAGIDSKFDVIVMIISLCQFRPTSINSLLEDFKKIARKVIIVEEALDRRRKMGCLRQRLMDYLGAVEYYIPCELFTFGEFEDMVKDHNYLFKRYNKRYAIGYYEQN